jgi:multidrug efflux pump subunit AcrB
VYQSLQTFLGGLYVNQFTRFGRLWKVYLQADGEYRRTVQDLGNYFVRSNNGEMIPLATLARTSETSGPNYILRFNLFPAAEITGGSGPGFSSGQTIEALKQTFDGTVADGFGYDWSGQTFQEIRAQGQQAIVFAMAILFVFLLLAALYESWTLPFSVLLGTPFALLGAMFGTWLLGLDNNLYTQIGIVLLIGLAAKNAILIVEFAKMGRDAGKPIDEAAAEAARLRFRPILMTAFAFILGVVPLVIASGPGAEMRQALGTAVFSGMIGVTLLGLLLTPVFYVAIRRLGRDGRGKPRTFNPTRGL